MSLKPDDLPSDLASAQAALLIEREALRAEREARLRIEVERDATAAKVTRIQAEAINWQAEAANARAKLSDNEALIAHLELRIEKLKRELYGPRSERTARLIEQLELELEELVTTASEDEVAAQAAAGGARFQAHAAGSQALAGRHRTRARRHRGSDELRLLRRIAAGEDRRGCDQDVGGDPASLQGHRDGAREVHLPRLREDHPAAGAVPCHAARLHRPAVAGDDPVRQVRHAYPAQPPERALQVRGDRLAAVDAGRSGRSRDLRRDAALPPDRAPCARCRAPAWRRHHHPHPGQEQVHNRADLDLCAG